MKLTKYILLSLLILTFSSSFSQQASSPESLLNDGDFFFFAEDYQEALYNYLKLENTVYANANLWYKTGVCYLHIPGEEAKAIPYLKKAVKDMTDKYKKRSTKETKAPEYALFYLGNAYRINNQLDKALEIYQQFKDLPNFEDRFNVNIVDNEISACEKAKIIQDNPIKTEDINIGEPINTGADNYLPVVSRDESMLAYMTALKFYNAIFVTKKEEGVWTPPMNITPQIGSDGDTYPTYISNDKTKIYLINGTGNNRDVYISTLKDGFWTAMEPLNDNINSPRAEAHASLSPDEKMLYFSSNRRGGIGELDIYVSEKQASGNWGPAENIGNTINTPFNEDAPFITDDQSRLFFVSQGHYNMGGYDIFYSEQANHQWQPPVNAGFPLNTTGDNFYFQPVFNGQAGYLSRISPDGFGGKDIYRIEILPSEKMVISTFEGLVEMSGKQVNWDNNFEIILKDKYTGKPVIRIIYDHIKKVFKYYSLTGNYQFEYQEK
ncbi:MAG: hypothetical protein GXO83_06345 [Chlorobi bacterium]|nr:hypothetical protein [Chlorobiota bacterium]